MIIYCTGTLKIYETRSDAPAFDWTGMAEYVIDETNPDNAELLTKIKDFAPYFDYVLDDEGNLIDVIKTADKPEPEPEPEPQPDPIADLQAENATLRAQVAALTQSTQFLEDCLVEMAETVYA